ncbi:MAG: hypothetical protein AAFX57_15000 [Bacteroidota bacterium]
MTWIIKAILIKVFNDSTPKFDLRVLVRTIGQMPVTYQLGWGLCTLFILAYFLILIKISWQFEFNLLTNIAVFNAGYKFLIIASLCPIIAMIADLIAQKIAQLFPKNFY